MDNGPFIGDFPIKTSIHGGFSIAMLFDYQSVVENGFLAGWEGMKLGSGWLGYYFPGKRKRPGPGWPRSIFQAVPGGPATNPWPTTSPLVREMKTPSHPWCNAVKDPAWRSMWMLCWTIVQSSGSALMQHANKAGSLATKNYWPRIPQIRPVGSFWKRKVCLLRVFKDLIIVIWFSYDFLFLSLRRVMIPNGKWCFNVGWDLRDLAPLGISWDHQASSGTSIAGSSYGGRRTPIFEPQDFHHNSVLDDFQWFSDDFLEELMSIDVNWCQTGQTQGEIQLYW